MSDTTARLERNRLSKAKANHDREPWADYEHDLLVDAWGSEPIEIIAEVLGRTIEACREHYYHSIRFGFQAGSKQDVQASRYIGHCDDPSEAWWNPDYYRRQA